MKNLILRATTGIVFVAVLVGCIIYGPSSFAILFGFITGLAVWEFTTLTNNYYEASVNKSITTVAGVYLFYAIFGYCNEMVRSDIFIPYLLTLIYLLISELYLKNANPLKNWALAFAVQLYVALPFALLSVLAFHVNPETSQIGYEWIYPLSVFIFLWTSDTGAYCVGSLLHKYIPYKLFERISPNKSWIGSIGGGILCLITATILHYYYPIMSLWQWMGMSLVVCLFGTWGDLIESLLKRQLKVKDSGNILPGHGGILDRFDSALIAIPATVIYFYVITHYIH